jgi:hypothetical protein
MTNQNTCWIAYNSQVTASRRCPLDFVIWHISCDIQSSAVEETICCLTISVITQ